jgi:hypothetical protein
MASADTRAEARQAEALGMRYFRVSNGVDRQDREVTCPASAEGGRKAQCSDCMLCAGTTKRARSIVIADHATGHARRVIAIKPAPSYGMSFGELREAVQLERALMLADQA